MQRAVTFTNPGELDRFGLTTLGVNVKEGPDPIGHFGTGLKYAIAILLRSGAKLTIWVGEDMLLLGTEEIDVRGKKFTVPTLDGERLGYTLELGKDWPFWSSFRELLCNCKDEGGECYSGAPRKGDIAPGRTTIMVESDEFYDVFQNRSDYVLESGPMMKLMTVDVHFGESRSLFYKGVKVYELSKPAKFRYNFRDKMQLTEDRTLRSVYDASTNLVWSLANSNEPDLLREVLTLGNGFWESSLDFTSGGIIYGDTFRTVLAELYNSKRAMDLPESLRRLYVKIAEVKRDKYQPVTPTEVEAQQLERAKAVVRQLEFEPDYFDIYVVESLGSGILGEWRNGSVYISRRAFAMGTKMVAGTLYEELLHARDGLIDESRSMQNHLIDRLMTVLETHVLKEPI